MADLSISFVPNLAFASEEACQVTQTAYLSQWRLGNETWPGDPPNRFKSKLFPI